MVEFMPKGPACNSRDRKIADLPPVTSTGPKDRYNLRSDCDGVDVSVLRTFARRSSHFSPI